MKWVLLCLILTVPVAATAGPEAAFRVDFSNPTIAPSTWTLTLNPDGSGHFHSERGNAPGGDHLAMETPNVDRDVTLSEPFVRHVFHAANNHTIHSGECESHLKVAFQGWKTLTYTGPDGTWSCQYNYSRDKEVQELGESLLATAATILEGVRLEMLLQHDRLGLDREMEYLSDAVGDGRLVQLCAIHDILERIAGDDAVMDRVRKRARLLLAKAQK
jgi:hypothetical protein